MLGRDGLFVYDDTDHGAASILVGGGKLANFVIEAFCQSFGAANITVKNGDFVLASGKIVEILVFVHQSVELVGVVVGEAVVAHVAIAVEASLDIKVDITSDRESTELLNHGGGKTRSAVDLEKKIVVVGLVGIDMGQIGGDGGDAKVVVSVLLYEGVAITPGKSAERIEK